MDSNDNAAACRTALTVAGYRVEDTEYAPFAQGNYGIRMRVLPGADDTQPPAPKQ